MKNFIRNFTLAAMAFSASAEASSKYFYLRCNSTSWALDETSRMKETSDPNHLEINFAILQSWMVEGNDSCTLTETTQRDDWNGIITHYKINGVLVAEGPSATLQLTAPSSTFNLKVPKQGPYKATLDLTSRAISLHSAAPSEPSNLELAWELKGGSLITDRGGHFFFQSAGSSNTSLSRVDAESGRELWKLTLPGYQYFDTNCSDGDSLFLYADYKIRAIHIDSGKELWTVDIPKGNQDYQGPITCRERTNEIYVNFGDGLKNIRAVNKKSGQIVWDFMNSDQGQSTPYIQNTDWTNLYLSDYVDGAIKLSAIDQKNGRLTWSQHLSQTSFLNVDGDGRLFLQGDKQVSRLSPKDGSTMWTYVSNADYLYLDNNAPGIIYANEPGLISRLDPDKGLPLWTYTYRSSDEDSPIFASVLKSGEVLINNFTESNKTLKVQLVGKDDGRLQWESTLSGDNYASVREDTAGNLFEFRSNRISGINKTNGKVKWSHVHEAEAGHGAEYIFNAEKVDGKVIVIYGLNGLKYPPIGFKILDADTGAVLGKNSLGAWGIGVKFTNKYLYFNVGFSSDVKVFAY